MKVTATTDLYLGEFNSLDAVPTPPAHMDFAIARSLSNPTGLTVWTYDEGQWSAPTIMANAEDLPESTKEIFISQGFSRRNIEIFLNISNKPEKLVNKMTISSITHVPAALAGQESAPLHLAYENTCLDKSENES